MSKLATAAAGAIAAVAALGLSPALAGECPADQVIAGSMTGDGHMQNKAVTDTVLAVNQLGDYHDDLAERVQRIRFLTVDPGGEVAWHEHTDRPALIYVVEGSITEYRSTCAVPIEHKAGEVASELGPLAHWWRNDSGAPAKLISADLPRSEKMPEVM